jgi:hypothetical protein
MTYHAESSDSFVTINTGSIFNGTRLTLASKTGTFTYDRLNPASIDVTGDIQLGGNVGGSGTQHYRGAVRLMGDRILSGLSVTVDSTVDSGALPGGPDTGTGDAALQIRGFFIDNGPLGSLARLKSFDVTAITVMNGGSITTAGNQTFEGTLNLAKDTTLISQADGTIRFGAAVDGLHSLSVQTTQGGLISFGGDVGAHGRLHDLILSTAGGHDTRSIPDKATIVGEHDITIKANNFVMGQNEKFTTLGNLTIDATASATLGDLVTVGNMTVTSPTITLLRRQAGSLLNAAGETIDDRGLDYVAGGDIAFTGTIALGGEADAPAPTFADVDGLPSDTTLFNSFEFKTSVPAETTAEALTLNGQTLDQRTTPPPPPPPPRRPRPRRPRRRRSWTGTS